jgi:hypothetical protein
LRRRTPSSDSCSIYDQQNCLTTRQFVCGLTLILAVAAFVRLYRITDRGLWYWDEGIFIMGARFVRWRVHEIILRICYWLNLSEAFLPTESHQGFPVFLQKPVHVILLSFFGLFNVNPILSASLFSVFSALVSIVLTAILARRWFSPFAGLGAAFFLSIQPFHVHYSRTALHETSSMALFLLMLVFFEMSFANVGIKSYVIALLAGFLAVSAIGASYRYIPYVGIVMILKICLDARDNKMKTLVIRWLWVVFGGAICFGLVNLSYRVAFFPHFLHFESSSYIDVLKMKFLSGESSFDFEHPFYYIRMLFHFDGFIPTIGWITALFTMIFQRRGNGLKTCLLVLLPLFLYSITTTRVPRTITGIYPFFAIAYGFLAAWLWYLCVKTFSKSTAFCIVSVYFVISGFAMLARLPSIWTIRSGYPDVVEWLEQSDDPRHFTTMFPVYAVYQGRNYSGPVPHSLEELRDRVEETGVRYLTVDWQKFLRYEPSVYAIERHQLPVSAFRHTPGDFMLSLYENHLPSDVPYLMRDPTLGYVKIYDLYHVLPAMGYSLDLTGIHRE